MSRPKLENNRVKITTTIDHALLKRAKMRAVEEEVEGVNAIIEKALEMYLKKEQ